MKRTLSLLLLAVLLLTPVCNALAFAAFAAEANASTATESATETKGMSFEQTDDYRADKPLTAIPHTFEATVWVPKDATFSTNSTIIGNYGGTLGAESLNFEITTAGTFRLFLVDQGQSTTNGNFYCTKKINTGEWTHIAITWAENEDKASATAYYYINGELMGSETRKTGSYPTFRVNGENNALNSVYANGGVVKPMRLGGDYRNSGANGNYCKIRVQDVAIYDDVRAANEIVADYQNGANGEGLLAKYTLPDNGEPAWVYDESGNGAHIQRKHTPTATTTETAGMSFTVDSDYKTEAPLSALPLTYEATVWFPSDMASTTFGGAILSSYGGSGSEQVNFTVNTNGQPQLTMNDKNASGSANWQFTQSAANLFNGKWTHVAITLSADRRTGICYINGVEIGRETRNEGAYPAFDHTPTKVSGLGRTNSAGENTTRYFKGRIQNVTLYADTRTPDEIIYDCAKSVDMTDTNLLARYDLAAGGEPTLIYDESGNGNYIRRLHTAAVDTVTDGMTFTADDKYRTEAPLSAMPHTFEATVWFPAGATYSAANVILGNSGGTGSEAINFEVLANGNPRLYLQDNQSSANVSAGNFQCPSVDLRTGEWTHVVITLSEDMRTATYYINGERVGSETRAEGKYPVFANGPEKVSCLGGDLRSGNSAYFKGYIKDITLYSDVRTLDEIKRDCAKSADLNDAGLLARYDLTAGGEPALIYDESRNGQNIKNLNVAGPEGMTFTATEQYKTEAPLSSVPHTFEATVYLPAGDYSAASVILGNSGGVGDEIINFEILANGNPRIYLQDNQNSANLADGNFQCPSVDLRTGEWTHVVITLSEDMSTATYYINGERVGSETRPEGKYPVFANGPEKILYLGGDMRTGNANYFKGRIKDVTLFSDVRTEAEIKSDYTAGVALDEAGLLVKYELPDDTAPAVIADASGNGYDMNRYNPWFSDKEPITDYAYSFAVVGDTQILNRDHPRHYVGIYDWLVENAAAKRMKFVFSMGDITDLDSAVEWTRAKENLHRLDGIVPYSVLRGNHDSAAKLNATFPYADYADELGGSYDGTIVNTWRELVVGEIKYLIFTLDYGPSDDVLAWAEDIIEANPNHNVIITTHAYLYRDGTTLDDGDLYPPSTTGGYNDGDDVWEKLIKKHENIVMVLSGHDSCDRVVMTQTAGDNGNIVTQFLVDPQGVDATEPAGLVTTMYFSEDGRNVSLECYSTVKEQYFMPENQFSFELPVVGTEGNTEISSAANIGIGATYDINIYLTVNGPVTAAGVQVNGVKLPGALQANGTYKVTVATAYAKDLLDTAVTYYPYYVTGGETVVSDTGVTVNAKDLLDAYLAGEYSEKAKALAQAALDYATVAKAYFAGETVDAATLEHLAAYDAAILAENDGMQVTAGTQYTFSAATLQIGETINFILAIGATDGSDLTALPATLTVDGTAVSVSEYLETTVKGRKMMLAVICGVPEAKFADALTFRLGDATLTYSVKDYCVRTLADAAEAEKNMIRAVYAIGVAAAAYEA